MKKDLKRLIPCADPGVGAKWSQHKRVLEPGEGVSKAQVSFKGTGRCYSNLHLTLLIVSHTHLNYYFVE
jgi:hypothetical protein